MPFSSPPCPYLTFSLFLFLQFQVNFFHFTVFMTMTWPNLNVVAIGRDGVNWPVASYLRPHSVFGPACAQF